MKHLFTFHFAFEFKKKICLKMPKVRTIAIEKSSLLIVTAFASRVHLFPNLPKPLPSQRYIQVSMAESAKT